MKMADEILAEAARTFKERNAVYGSNYETVGPAVAALFPDGITMKTGADWNRMHIFLLVMVKLSRYAIAWDDMHQDSIHDAMVYCAMLEMIDGNIKAEESGATGGDHASLLAASLGIAEELVSEDRLVEALNASEGDQYVGRTFGEIEQELAAGAALDQSGIDHGAPEQGDGSWTSQQGPNPGASSTRDLDAFAGGKRPDVSAAGWR